MQFEITLHGNETPEQINRCIVALGAYAGKSSKAGEQIDVTTLRSASREYVAGRTSGDAVFGNRTLVLPPVAEGESEALLAKLEAENPQFGQQPLPEGAEPVAGPLAPTPLAAPSPAVAEASASAPAAAPASIPPPPSAAGAVPSPPPAAATPAPVGAVDAKGLPWDERIHASSRAKIADGSWRMKRGVQQHVVDTVEAQLRAQAPVAASEPAAPPGPPAPPAAPVAGAGLTFGQLAKRVGAKITLGELTAADLAAKMAALGFPGGLHEANARPDMWATILETLGA